MASAPAQALATEEDPVLAAIRRAPMVHVLTPQQRAEADAALADLRAGRSVLVPHDEVPAYLEALDAQAGGE